MANFDQAEGLRRMLFSAKPRFVTFLSALTSDEKNATLVNLSAGLFRLGNDVMLLDASQHGTSLARWLEKRIDSTLMDVAQQKRTMQQAIFETTQGFKLASINRYQSATPTFQTTSLHLTKLNKVIEQLGNSVDIVLVDGELSDINKLAALALEEGEIVIQLTNQSNSIKTAYSLIKRAHSQYGRREFGVLVTGVNEFEAHRVYETMAQAADNFLSVTINFVGYVPEDDCLRRATRSGRAVIDAFPTAGAAMAFSRLAQNMTGYEFASTT